jgi:hypothetical protein
VNTIDRSLPVEQAHVEWTFNAKAQTFTDLLEVVREAASAENTTGDVSGGDAVGDVDRPYETPGLPKLVGKKEVCEDLLNVPRMTVDRWLEPGSGGEFGFGLDRTHLIPPAHIAAGPVWVESDIIRWREEVGRKRKRPK